MMSTDRDVTRRTVTRRAFNARLGTAALGLCLGSLPAWRAPAAAQDIRYLRIGTGDIGGVYFRIGGMLANVFSDPGYNTDCSETGLCGVPGLIAISQATDGSVENMELLEGGQLEAALAQADVAYWAFRGEKLYDGAPHESIRGVANLYGEAVHIVVRADSPIKALPDLRSRRVIVGAAGSGSLIGAEMILAAAGLSLRDIEPVYENLARGAGLIKSGDADALFAIAGAPAPALQALAHDPGFRLVAIEDEPAQDVTDAAPFFTRARITEDSYDGVEATQTLAVGAQLFIRSDVAEETVFALTRALWHPSNRQVLNNGHALGQRILLNTALDGMVVPLHPGAERYYETAMPLDEPDIEGPAEPADGPAEGEGPNMLRPR